MENQGEEFLSGILFDGQHDHVSGLDVINIPITSKSISNSLAKTVWQILTFDKLIKRMASQIFDDLQ